MNYKELNDMLVARAEEVCRHLFPNGKRKGNKWVFGDINGSDGESSGVVLSGSHAGSWADWASGQKNTTLVALWSESRCNGEFPKAMDEIKEYLGVRDDFKLHAPKKQYCAPTKAEKSRVRFVDQRGKVAKYLSDERGFSLDIIGKFKVAADETDSKYVFPYFDGSDLVMLKTVDLTRENGKKRMFATKEAKPVLFGKPCVPLSARNIVITEGEFDAMSWSQLGVPAVSIPQGCQNMNWIENDWEWLDRFETIYVNFDSDEAGQEGAKKLIDRLGADRCMNVSLGDYKDANDMLTSCEDDPEKFIREAKHIMPEDIESFSEHWDDLIHEMTVAVENPEGIKTPWPDLKWRIRPKEVTCVVGFTGHGKSTAVSQLAVHLQAAGWPGIIASLESETIGMKADFVRTACGTYSPTVDQINECKTSNIFNSMYIVNRKQDREIEAEEIYKYFRLCARKYGCKYAVLDNMMMCKVKGDDLDSQKHFVEQLQRLASDTGMHIFLVVHPRKPPSDKELERPPSIYEAKGAGEIVNLVHNFMSVWRNVPKHMEVGKLKKKQEIEGVFSDKLIDLQKKPDGRIELQKQRCGVGIEKGWIGGTDTWQRGKCQLVPEENAQPISYIDEAALETHF